MMCIYQAWEKHRNVKKNLSIAASMFLSTESHKIDREKKRNDEQVIAIINVNKYLSEDSSHPF